MRRKNSRYPRTPYGRGGQPATFAPARAGLTRRALLGAIGVIGAGGLVEMLRGSSHRAAAVARDTSQRVLRHPGATTANQGSVTPSTTHRGAQAGRGAAHGRSPGHGHGSGHHVPGHPHGHGDAPAHHHGHHDSLDDVHGHGPAARRERARIRKAEQVKLPPPQVRVRARTRSTRSPSSSTTRRTRRSRSPSTTARTRTGPRRCCGCSTSTTCRRRSASSASTPTPIPKLIRDIHKAGHVIVNHSYTHVQPFARQTEKRIVAEITRTQRAIEKAAKVTPELFRSPGGDWSHFVFRAIAAYGLTPLDWDIDPRDWARPGTTEDRARDAQGPARRHRAVPRRRRRTAARPSARCARCCRPGSTAATRRSR